MLEELKDQYKAAKEELKNLKPMPNSFRSGIFQSVISNYGQVFYGWNWSGSSPRYFGKHGY